MKKYTKRRRYRKKRINPIVVCLLAAAVMLGIYTGVIPAEVLEDAGLSGPRTEAPEEGGAAQADAVSPVTDAATGLPDYASLAALPDYSGHLVVLIQGNIPSLSTEDGTVSFEHYSELDALGRCGAAYASVGQDIMPTEERGQIGSVKPTGWHTVKYDHIDGKYLFNRCHLLGYQLTGENANERNLITGTRYLNVAGMQPFEDRIAAYVKETGNHVLYRVTPYFEGNNLTATGVEMEGLSVEDNGSGICFHVFVYNIQPGVIIDYTDGESRLDGEWDGSLEEIPFDRILK